MVTWTEIESPLGPLRLASDGQALTGLFMDAPRYGPAGYPDDHRGSDPVLARAAAQLAEYFAGERRSFDLPLAPRGTEFQERVWRALLDIPFGQTLSYGDLARRLGDPLKVRAVGSANGRNPISIIIPCHRVVGADGSLVGYGGGLPRKRWLLDHETRIAGVVLD